MSHSLPLLDCLQQALSLRAQQGMTMISLDPPLLSHAPDFFSNDYLSLSTDRSIRDTFLHKVQAAAPTRLLGSTGSRLVTGNSSEFNALEKAFQHFFEAPSALLFPSGFNANVAFFSTVPQKQDVIIYDEVLHMSCREGIRASPSTSYRFSHNSVTSFKECLLGVLKKHPHITQGTATVFVSVETLYSMDGDFCPLTEIVEIVESLVPSGHAHIVVDEAHTSGVCGPNGKGYVSHLGLNDRVHTKVHTFGKAWGFHGAVVLASPIIRDYLIHFGRSIMFSTSMPYTDIYALESLLGVISSAQTQELRERLNHLCRYARRKLFLALRNVPENVLALCKFDGNLVISDPALCSPIIPVFTPGASRLRDHLFQRGYAPTAITLPAVKRPRIRIVIHAGNTEGEVDLLINDILSWVHEEHEQFEFMSSAHASGSAGMDKSYAQTKARL